MIMLFLNCFLELIFKKSKIDLCTKISLKADQRNFLLKLSKSYIMNNYAGVVNEAFNCTHNQHTENPQHLFLRQKDTADLAERVSSGKNL